ncbi:hypothetical protein JW930_04420 [Candidatus Woesearchaeota archaeon]|nr:hypothetical protein [Candidatus Woesearchaeota archaeon]
MSSIEEIRILILATAKEKNISLRFSEEFNKLIKKTKDTNTKIRLFKQILKIVQNPSIGKHMRYSRKGEQEVYLDSFRLYYVYYEQERIIRFVEYSHKDEQ